MATSTTMDNKRHLKFLSYNLYCLPWIATAFSPSSCPLSAERSAAFLKHIPDYDVIALQEVWDPRYKMIQQFARSNKLHVVGSSAPSAGKYLNLRVFGGGLMIISKHPIVDTKEITFDKGSHSDRFVAKGVVYAKIQVDSSYVHVFNTHLQASYGHEFNFTSNPYANIRKKQLKKFAQFIQRVTANDSYPILLAGDFNVNARAAPDNGSDSKEYTDMLELLQHTSYKIVDLLKEKHGEHPITYGGNGVVHGEAPKVGGQRLDFLLHLERDASAHNIDHLFLDGAIVPFQAEGEVYSHISDHYAQTVTLEITMKGIAPENGGKSVGKGGKKKGVEVDGADVRNLSQASIGVA